MKEEKKNWENITSMMQYDVGVARDCYCYAIDAVELDRFARVGKPVRFLRDSPLYSDEAGG